VEGWAAALEMAPCDARRVTDWPDIIHFAAKGGVKSAIGWQPPRQPAGPPAMIARSRSIAPIYRLKNII
ncbi:MAG: hypothetical protein O7A66_10600, partial [Alphaproteobacteria bacterium]|nr:hypothetical protein [Alphaproteobacteria bacterium]